MSLLSEKVDKHARGFAQSLVICAALSCYAGAYAAETVRVFEDRQKNHSLDQVNLSSGEVINIGDYTVQAPASRSATACVGEFQSIFYIWTNAKTLYTDAGQVFNMSADQVFFKEGVDAGLVVNVDDFDFQTDFNAGSGIDCDSLANAFIGAGSDSAAAGVSNGGIVTLPNLLAAAGVVAVAVAVSDDDDPAPAPAIIPPPPPQNGGNQGGGGDQGGGNGGNQGGGGPQPIPTEEETPTPTPEPMSPSS